MTKYFSYRICSICFNDLVETSNFDSSQLFILVDTSDNEHSSYFLDESVPCDLFLLEEESMCSIQGNNA